MTPPVLIIGGGGHAKVLIEALRLSSVTILGIVDTDPAKSGCEIFGVRVLGNDDVVSGYDPETLQLVNGVGSVHVPKRRKDVFEMFKRKGFSFATVIHPSAVTASDIVLGEGAQIMAGVVIQPGSKIGVNTIVNTNASVDHDCNIGDHVHIAPGATLSGCVAVGSTVHIGTGATVTQAVRIGSNSMISAGAVVIENIDDNMMVAGVPARVVQK